MARIKIGSKLYSAASLDEVSLRDLMLFNTEAAEFGVTWSDVEALGGQIDELTEDEAARHPQKYLMFAVMIWISRRAAGEDLTFGDAINVPISQIDVVPDPEDRKPGKAKGAKKAQKSTKASAVAESPAEPSGPAEMSTTSASPSTPASSA